MRVSEPVERVSWPAIEIDFCYARDKERVSARKVKLSSAQTGALVKALGYDQVFFGEERLFRGAPGGARRAFASVGEIVGDLLERCAWLQGAEVYLQRPVEIADWSSSAALSGSEPLRWEAPLRQSYASGQEPASWETMREKARGAAKAFQSALAELGASAELFKRSGAPLSKAGADAAIHGGGCVFKAPDDSGWWALAIEGEAWERARASDPWSRALGCSQSGLVKAMRLSAKMDAWSDSSQSGFSHYISRSQERVYPHASWKLSSAAPQDPQALRAGLEAFFGDGSVASAQWLPVDPNAASGMDSEISQWKRERYRAGEARDEGQAIESAAGAPARARARSSI